MRVKIVFILRFYGKNITENKQNLMVIDIKYFIFSTPACMRSAAKLVSDWKP